MAKEKSYFNVISNKRTLIDLHKIGAIDSICWINENVTGILTKPKITNRTDLYHSLVIGSYIFRYFLTSLFSFIWAFMMMTHEYFKLWKTASSWDDR